jgi:hypothetical protein
VCGTNIGTAINVSANGKAPEHSQKGQIL